MPLSKSCIYGLRASVYLASRKSNEFVNIREISSELDISFHFLTKVLQELNRAEILESYKGPNGGVKLAKPANKITFWDIVYAIDSDHTFTDCILGLPGCGELNPCPLHDQWSRLKEDLLDMMEHSTLRELATRHIEFSNQLNQLSDKAQKNFQINKTKYS